MIRKFFYLLIQAILVSALLVGLLLVWFSFQSFESMKSLLNHLASDGEFELFTLALYQILRIPFSLVGIILVVVTGIMLYRWKKTETWLQGFLAHVGRFFQMLRQDAHSFFDDARREINSHGWVGIASLVGLTLAALVIRLANLDIPLSHDEAYTYNAFASRSIWHIVSDYHLPNNHVFLSLVLNLTTRLIGNDVWALRLPTIITGALMVPAIYWLAKRLYNQETALLSATLIIMFPVLIKYSVYARGYAIIILITLLILALGDYVRVKKNRFAWMLIVLLSVLGFFTIPIMLFPFGALYIWLLISCALADTRSYESKLAFLKYWVGSGISTALVTIVLYTPIIVNNYAYFFGNGVIAPLEWEIFPATIWVRLRNTWIEWTDSIPLWIVVLGVLGILISLFFHKRISRQKFPVQFAFIIWILIMLIWRRPDMLPRFWSFLSAPLLVWSAAGVVELLRKIPGKIGKDWNPVRIIVSLIFTFVIIQSILMLPAIPTAFQNKDDMEKITIYLKNHIQEGDLVTATPARLPALRYYFNIYEIPKGYIRQSGSFQRAFVVVDHKKSETLSTIAPRYGFDIPTVDMKTVRIVLQLDDFTVYECNPAP